MGSAKSAGAAKFAEAFQVDTPEAAMRIACASLLRMCGIDRPPVSLKKLLTYLDVRVDVIDRPLKADAELHLKKGQFTVVVSSQKLRQNWERTRFTIAHEFGHILLAHHLADAALFTSLDENLESHRENERLCDLAAKELLMPTAMVKSALYENGLSPSGLGAIRHAFGVSRMAIIKSIAEALPDTFLFTWRKHARHAKEQSTYRVVSSTKYHPSNANPWLPAGCTSDHVWPRVLQKAANKKTAIFEEEVEVRLHPRRWRGQGAVTFFPFDYAVQQELNGSASEKRDGPNAAPQTLYLLLSGRDSALAQYLRCGHDH
jgi:Zn-dependent peptidase ImmA (M78 family)